MLPPGARNPKTVKDDFTECFSFSCILNTFVCIYEMCKCVCKPMCHMTKSNRLLLNTWMVCFSQIIEGRVYTIYGFLLNVSYYYASLYAIENRYRALHLPVRHVSAMIRGFLCAQPQAHNYRRVHDTSRGTSCFSRGASHLVTCTSRLVASHISWHSTSRGTSHLM